MSNEELVQLYQAGNKGALDKLIELNKGIVYKFANRFYTEKTNSIDKEDLKQEGFMGLMVAADKYKFNIEKPCKFSTYAVYWIYHKMNRFIKSKNTNEETSLNIPNSSDGDIEFMDCIEGVDYGFENVEDKIYNEQLHRELEEVMARYNTLKEREILKFRYGWDNYKCMTCGQIGEIYNVTRSKINNIEHTALGKIRRSSWGAAKAKEMYIQKRRQSVHSISGTIESMSFAARYLL
ncbi:sigma-70 family RNA polymerase sigma factor [Clostridium kluyveri]|uniref:RNA polymerase sigma factor-related protein n=2 Tax=Clostridium kluyveri TaxID=1534 RepID=A5N1H5_CLOK5|nr:sigma-70 family RNA polymerase sigma factor [Clostridium kluyveri]EDK34971.1 RNA polymerase sigma factor-related protein [Clostridium kluyveri DSM 555]